jgi:hypothetical protein
MLIKTKTAIINFANICSIEPFSHDLGLRIHAAGNVSDIWLESKAKKEAAFNAIFEALKNKELFIDISEFQD